MHLARDRISLLHLVFFFLFPAEVTGQDSTLYLLASKLIISQTFHYMNQTTASSSLASSSVSFSLFFSFSRYEKSNV